MSTIGPDTTVICGVPLVQYAGVTAAIAEGFPLHEILEIEGLSAKTWADAKLAWKGRLVKDSMSSGDLFEAYTREIAAAEDRLSRKVAPLDGDVGAWVVFLKLYSAQGAPFDWLARLGLGLNDVSRLERAWSRRVDESTALQKQVAELRKKPVGDLPRLQIEPSVLSRSPGALAAKPANLKSAKAADPKSAKPADPKSAKPADLKSPRPTDPKPGKPVEPRESASRAADDASSKPVEAVPSYLQARRPIHALVTGTIEVVLPPGQTLPFQESDADVDEATEKARAHAEAVQGPARTTNLTRGETLDLGAILASKAALFADPPETPDAAEAPDAPVASPALQVPPFAPPVNRPKKGPQTVEVLLAQSTMTLEGLPSVADVLPFPSAASAPVAKAPPSSAVVAHTPFANTPFANAPVANTPFANTPFANAPVANAPPSPAVAKAPVASGPPSMPVPKGPPSMPVPSGPPSMPVPGAAPAPPRAAVPSYTVQQYASLWVELSLDPEHAAQTLARYRLTPELRAALDADWGARLAADPTLRATFDQAAVTYRDILLRGRRR